MSSIPELLRDAMDYITSPEFAPVIIVASWTLLTLVPLVLVAAIWRRIYRRRRRAQLHARWRAEGEQLRRSDGPEDPALGPVPVSPRGPSPLFTAHAGPIRVSRAGWIERGRTQ